MSAASAFYAVTECRSWSYRALQYAKSYPNAEGWTASIQSTLPFLDLLLDYVTRAYEQENRQALNNATALDIGSDFDFDRELQALIQLPETACTHLAISTGTPPGVPSYDPTEPTLATALPIEEDYNPDFLFSEEASPSPVTDAPGSASLTRYLPNGSVVLAHTAAATQENVIVFVATLPTV